MEELEGGVYEGIGREDLGDVGGGERYERLSAAIERGRERFGLPAGCRVLSCYEAGRDGFWLDRLLKGWKVENLVVDSSSIEVNRRARRAKTDGLDVAKLLSMLVRYDLGERKVWSVVRVPSVEEEDARQLHRELRTLKKEQTRLANRIRGLLASQGVDARMGKRGLLDGLEQIRLWDGSVLPEGIRGRVQREVDRYRFLHEQVLELEAESQKAVQAGDSVAAEKIRRLMSLRAVGRVSATILEREFGWRGIRNRRQIGSLSGLAPTPFQSGEMSRERGISRAGNRHVRGIAIDLAWGWLRRQPDSELSRWYKRRFAGGGPRLRKIGIVAVARKLLIALWRFSSFGELPKGAVLKAGI